MTRIESVRTAKGAAKGTAKESVRQARSAARQAAREYESRLAPRIEHARETLPPAVDQATTEAAKRTRKAARKAADYAAPRVEAARAAAGPAREEAVARSTAALAALRGEVSPKDVEKLSRKRARRARAGKAFKGVLVLGALTGVAMAAWRWWDQQANPDWLVEPPEPTEVSSEE